MASSSIHPTALVAEGVKMGAACRIGPFVIIEPGAVLGDYVSVAPYTLVADGCELRAHAEVGSHVMLHAGTVLDYGAQLDTGVRSSGNNFVGAMSTVRYDAILCTGLVLGERCYVAPQVMTINRDVRGQAIGGAQIGERCFLGTGCVINPGLTIAPRTVIGAKALVTRSIEVPDGTYVGVPARRR